MVIGISAFLLKNIFLVILVAGGCTMSLIGLWAIFHEFSIFESIIFLDLGIYITLYKLELYIRELQIHSFCKSLDKKDIEYIKINKKMMSREDIKKITILFKNHKWAFTFNSNAGNFYNNIIFVVKFKNNKEKIFEIWYNKNKQAIIRSNNGLISNNEMAKIFIPKLYEFLKEKRLTLQG